MKKADSLAGLLRNVFSDRAKLLNALHIGPYEGHPFAVRHQEPAYSFTFSVLGYKGEHLVDL